MVNWISVHNPSMLTLLNLSNCNVVSVHQVATYALLNGLGMHLLVVIINKYVTVIKASFVCVL